MEDSDLPSSEETAKGTRDWPHAPPHRLSEAGVYFVTARTRNQRHILADEGMKDWFQNQLQELVDEFDWTLEAWCILSNHHHLVAHSPVGVKNAESLRELLRKLHSLATKEFNRRNNSRKRRLWQNFRDTHLTYQRSYLARLHYVHQNAVHHGLVRQGSDWKWCSAAAFKKAVSTAWLKTITSFHYDQIAANDGE